MPKIDVLIRDISEAYASYVNLAEEFSDDEKNRGRMKGYRPIESHRDALGRLIRALYPNDHRVYALRGSYGTGKSHLFLMLANYFQPVNRRSCRDGKRGDFPSMSLRSVFGHIRVGTCSIVSTKRIRR